MRLLGLIPLGMLISGLSLYAQTETISDIEYTYDSAGNRVTREIIYYEGGTKSAAVPVEEEQEFGRDLNVYPNPATHSLYVSLNKEVLDERDKMIMVFDNLGKLIYQTGNLGEINQVDVSNWIEGTYILKLIYGHRHKEWIIVKN